MMATAVSFQPRINQITAVVVSAAMKVHSVLGPGLLENTYVTCLGHELRKRGVRLSGIRVGLLINFYVAHLRDGIKRMVDGWEWQKQ